MSAIVMQTATRKQRLQRARQLVQQYVKTNISLVDELIKERRRAAVDEQREPLSTIMMCV